MRRSVLNRYIQEAAAFFAEHHFALPPFAFWTPDDWRRLGRDGDELRIQRLGWDVTDFNSGNFESRGLTIFTLRNGLSASAQTAKPYAEKIMMVRNQQLTPLHYHARKTEDIINRGFGGMGRLVVQLYGSTSDGRLADDSLAVVCDGISRPVEAGGVVVLAPGESITLPPYLCHAFRAIDGDALIGEVSSINDDDTDNFFHEPIGRFPEIEEDEPPLRLLCTEY